MKRTRLVTRLLDDSLAEVARADIALEGSLAANVNASSPFRIEVYLETREWIAQTAMPFWDTRG